MRIDNSTVTLVASHESRQVQTTEVRVSNNFRQLIQAQSMQREDPAGERERLANLLKTLVDAILAAIEGKSCVEKIAATDVPPSAPAQGVLPDRIQPEGSYAWQCSTVQTLSESEKTTICGSGQVNTQDGRNIDFSFVFSLSREFKQTSTLLEAGRFVLRDPLVLNFDGKSSQLRRDTLSFDLNADGQLEAMPMLGGDSSFLVLDRNHNGRIDDGSELFGALSGDGFADLAQFDLDKNDWIDENDPVFAQLGLWSGREIDSLKAKGIGALYDAPVNAPFALKDENNQLLGEIRAASIYLTEAGQIGQLQQLDLAISRTTAGENKPEQGQQLPA
jgi:hypothetical protein